jgi:hypothetical protein
MHDADPWAGLGASRHLAANYIDEPSLFLGVRGIDSTYRNRVTRRAAMSCLRRIQEEEGLHWCVQAATPQWTPGIPESCEQLSSDCHS